uniref:Uncharacterized protein n=1 Tax=Oryza nivara TaxID=4536 RepID=A0A0E0I220_ORYNI
MMSGRSVWMDSNNVEYCVALNRLSSLWNLLDALHKIACVDFASTYLSLIKEANHIILGSWSYSQALALIFYGSNFVLNRHKYSMFVEQDFVESKEQKKFIRNVNLPYISELGHIVEKNQRMLALIIVHLHKKSRWIKSSLSKYVQNSFLYHFNSFSISEIHIHCEPNYTCRQPPNLRDQEISLDRLKN